MPELPDITAYMKAIDSRTRDRCLERVRVVSPFLLRTAVPPVSEAQGKRVTGVRRIGKQVVLCLEDDLFLVFHLMIAGRFHWKEPHPGTLSGKVNLAAFDFEGEGTLLLTEASTKKRASLHMVCGEEALEPFDRGGLESLDADLDAFSGVLQRENHTLKRTLTDPRLFSGIGNAYSDEILHRSRLSPGKLTQKLDSEETQRLFAATREVLQEWITRLDPASDGKFPEKVTAFRPEMAVHGKYNQPCPVCGSPVQRISYADNEANYCATCQTDGRLLADRGLSRLLKQDWPRTLQDLENGRTARRLLSTPVVECDTA